MAVGKSNVIVKVDEKVTKSVLDKTNTTQSQIQKMKTIESQSIVHFTDVSQILYFSNLTL